MNKDKIKGIAVVGMLCLSAVAGTVGISKATVVIDSGEERKNVLTPSEYKEGSIALIDGYDDTNFDEYDDSYENISQYEGDVLYLDGDSVGTDGDSSDIGLYELFSSADKATDSSFSNETDLADINDGSVVGAEKPEESVSDPDISTTSEGTGIATYGTSWCRWDSPHTWSASYNGSNLVLSFYIDFEALGGGSTKYAPQYRYGFTTKTNEVSSPSNILTCSQQYAFSKDKVSSTYGTVNITEFSLTSAVGGGHMKMVGTVTIDNKYLSALSKNGLFGYTAGGWGEDSDGSWEARDFNWLQPKGFAAALKKAQCEHTTLTYASNGTGGHTVTCSNCGYSYTEAHALSGARCTKCSYVTTVNITLRYVLAKTTTTETIPLTPGQVYQPKSFTGYRKPATITVPSSAKTIDINYTPITYTITDGSSTYTLKYDEVKQLPVVNQEGYTHSSYQVMEVR